MVTGFPLPVTEVVIRHRGAVRDENGALTADTAVEVGAFAVEPGGGAHRTGTARDGEDTTCTVYLPYDTDIADGDGLTVRGRRYSRITVKSWDFGGLSGVEVVCQRSQG